MLLFEACKYSVDAQSAGIPVHTKPAFAKISQFFIGISGLYVNIVFI